MSVYNNYKTVFFKYSMYNRLYNIYINHIKQYLQKLKVLSRYSNSLFLKLNKEL